MADMTLAEIQQQHAGCYVEAFDAGLVDDGNGGECAGLDVIVWADKDAAKNDDGAKAVARYLIPAA